MEENNLNLNLNEEDNVVDFVAPAFSTNTQPEWTWKRFVITTWLPQYNFPILLQDLLAGFTVGLTEIPQGIAFALIAGLSPEYGLYSGFMGGLVYSIFGSCKDVNIGPTSILALMIQPQVARMGPDVAVLITFLAGIIICVFSVLNLGFVVEFFSYPIIAGFTCAASLQIGSSQIKSLLGIPGKADAFLDAWIMVLRNIRQIRLWDSILGVFSIVFLVVLKNVGSYGGLQMRSDLSRGRNVLRVSLFMLSLARNALVVLIGTILAYCLRDEDPLIITGQVKGGLPPFEPPPFSTTHKNVTYDFIDISEGYGTGLIFIPLVAILEAISIAKAFSKGATVDATQEMLALGLCNFMGSWVRSMPVTGSFTRTAVNNASGVKTPLAGVFTSALVLLALLFLTPSFYYVPKTTLASVIICAMFYLFDYDAFILLWRTKRLDLVPFLATLISCLFLGLEYGILIGIAVNLLFVLYASARPNINHSIAEIGDFQVLSLMPKDTLYFPSAEFLREFVQVKISGMRSRGAKILVVIDGKNLNTVDVTIAKSLVAVIKNINSWELDIVLLNFQPTIQEIIRRTVGGSGEVFFQDLPDGNLERVVSVLQMRNMGGEMGQALIV